LPPTVSAYVGLNADGIVMLLHNSFTGKFAQCWRLSLVHYFPLTQICPGSHLLDFNTWKSLNRIRTGVAPVKANTVKWGKTNSDDLYCGCGEVQDMEHLLSCRDCPYKCTLEDLWLANKKGFDVAQCWAKNL
jgi:hypothetical protein